MSDLVKKGHTKDSYTPEQLAELARCLDDPVYFTENYVKVQNVKYGMVLLKLYDFQRDMLNAFHTHRFVIGLTGRQLGKSFSSTTRITKNGKQTRMIDVISPSLSIKEKIVDLLERILVNLSR